MLNIKHSLSCDNLTPSQFELNTECESGIAHIGCGNFHRSHQEYFLNELLKQDYNTNKKWMYTAIGVLHNDIYLKNKLKKNNYKYHILSINNDGTVDIEYINTLQNMFITYENLTQCFKILINPNIKIVSLTITEYGYSIPLSATDTELIYGALQSVINESLCNISAFGLIIAALAFRYTNNIRPFTIMSCDNLINNGEICKNKCIEISKNLFHSKFHSWIVNEVKFPSTMVDRITPYISEQEIIELEKKYTIIDSCPVLCENYKSWIIEDNFVDNCRPQWENVGTILTSDVKPYEYMKLCLLNIPHSFIAYCGILKNYIYVHEVIHDPELLFLVQNFITIDILPVIEKEIKNLDYIQYIRDVLSRFSNKFMKDKLSRIAQDGRSKFVNQGLPILLKGLNMNFEMKYFKIYIKNWMKYDNIKMNDPLFSDIYDWLLT